MHNPVLPKADGNYNILPFCIEVQCLNIIIEIDYIQSYAVNLKLYCLVKAFW